MKPRARVRRTRAGKERSGVCRGLRRCLGVYAGVFWRAMIIAMRARVPSKKNASARGGCPFDGAGDRVELDR